PLLSPTGRFPLAFWLVLSAAVLVRGPVALLLAALVATSFVTAVRDPGRLLRLRPFSGVLLLSLIVSPVWLRLTARDPAYLPEFLWRYNVLRYLNAEVAGSHSEPFLFYLWFTPILILPWAIFLPWSLRPPRTRSGDEAHLYLLGWIVVFLGFFTLSAAKFPTYVLPTLFPLSLLTAAWLERRLGDAARPRLRDPILLGGAVIFLVVILAPLAGYQIVSRSFPTYAPNTAYLLLMIPFAIPGLAAVAGRSRAGVFASITACSTVCLLGLYRFGSATVSAYNSMEVPAELIVRHLPPDASIISYRTTTHSLSFYSGRPSRAVELLGDATSLLDADHPTALLTKDRYLPDLRGRMSRPVYFWWEADSKKILLANRPPPDGADL
ncbi:MAG: hypothetical protein ACREQY_20630, partial [Candidatus Binatia bacterium]